LLARRPPLARPVGPPPPMAPSRTSLPNRNCPLSLGLKTLIVSVLLFTGLKAPRPGVACPSGRERRHPAPSSHIYLSVGSWACKPSALSIRPRAGPHPACTAPRAQQPRGSIRQALTQLVRLPEPSSPVALSVRPSPSLYGSQSPAAPWLVVSTVKRSATTLTWGARRKIGGRRAPQTLTPKKARPQPPRPSVRLSVCLPAAPRERRSVTRHWHGVCDTPSDAPRLSLRVLLSALSLRPTKRGRRKPENPINTKKAGCGAQSQPLTQRVRLPQAPSSMRRGVTTEGVSDQRHLPDRLESLNPPPFSCSTR
jgi:hypothetical protein